MIAGAGFEMFGEVAREGIETVQEPIHRPGDDKPFCAEGHETIQFGNCIGIGLALGITSAFFLAAAPRRITDD